MSGSRRWIVRGAAALAAMMLLGYGVGALSRRPGPTVGPTRGVVSGGGSSITGGPEAYRPDVSSKDAAAPAAAPAGNLPASPDRVVKNGEITVEVKAKGFDTAWSRAFQVAARFGGYVASSSRGTGGPVPVEGDTRALPLSGDIVIRVPAAHFEEAMNDLGGLGTIKGQNSSSTDVSADFVDLESRLRNQRAQEAVLLKLMAKATSIEESIAVQARLSDVQQQIEELTGRLRLLRSQTDLSTISAHLAEPGAVEEPGTTPSFSRAWRTALEGLARIWSTVMIGLVWAAPFALIWVVARRWRSRPTPPAQG